MVSLILSTFTEDFASTMALRSQLKMYVILLNAQLKDHRAGSLLALPAPTNSSLKKTLTLQESYYRKVMKDIK